MSRARDREKLLGFLHTIRRPEREPEEIDEDESLVEAGLIDSLALLEIVTFLETEYGLDFAERGVDPGELSTIEGILALMQTGRA